MEASVQHIARLTTDLLLNFLRGMLLRVLIFSTFVLTDWGPRCGIRSRQWIRALRWLPLPLWCLRRHGLWYPLLRQTSLI